MRLRAELVLLLFILTGCSRAGDPNIAKIRELGGEAVVMRPSQDDAVTAVTLSYSNAQDSDLAILSAFEKLRLLNLARTRITDAGLADLLAINHCARQPAHGWHHDPL